MKTRYSESEMVKIILEHVSCCGILDHVESLVHWLYECNFLMLKGLAKALTIIAKGKVV